MYSQNITILRLSILQIHTTKTAQQCTARLQLSPLGSLIYNSVATTHRILLVALWLYCQSNFNLTLIVPRAWEIGYTQPCIKCQGRRLFILFIFEVEKLSTIHIGKPLHTFHNKIKAFTSEPLPYLLQTVTKISTLYNFYEWRV